MKICIYLLCVLLYNTTIVVADNGQTKYLDGWKGIACDWSNATLSEYAGIECFLSSDHDHCIVKGDVTENLQAMINKTEDVEGSRLRNTKGLVLWESKGNNMICDFLEKDKCIRGSLLLVCDNKNSRVLAIDSNESTSRITVAKIEKCERLAFLESDLMVLYVSTPSTIFKVNLQNNNVTELKGVSKEGSRFKGMCLSKDFLFYTYVKSNDKKPGGYVGRYKLHGRGKNFSKNIITKS